MTVTSSSPGGGLMTLDNGGNPVALVVSGSGQAIDAHVAVQLDSDAWITTGGSADSLTIAGDIRDGAAPHGIEKDGPGTLVLSGSNTYTGGTEVYGGTLVIASAESVAAGTDLNVGAGCSLYFGVQAYSTGSGPATVALTTAATAVPEPGTFLLVAAGALTATRLRRKLPRKTE